MSTVIVSMCLSVVYVHLGRWRQRENNILIQKTLSL